MTENDTHAMKILSPTIAGGAAAFLSEILLLADSTSPCVCYWNIGVTPTIVPRIIDMTIPRIIFYSVSKKL